MAIWVELRCERRGEGNSCWSDNNDGPGELCDDNQQSMIRTFGELKKNAIKAGWKNIRGEGLVCPECLKSGS